MQLTFWLILFVIGVFDAREYRIPNALVLLLFGVSVVTSIFQPSSQDWLAHIYGFTAAFSVGLVFYSFKIMAAGDVKLIGVVGFLLCPNGLLLLAKYIAFSCCFVGAMYWLLNHLDESKLIRAAELKKDYHPIRIISVRTYQLIADLRAGSNLAYMPFAPILILALAMYQYFQH